MPILSQIFVVFGQKILIFTGERNSFGTHITEKPPRHLIRIIFWSGMGSNGPQMPIFGQKKQFWAKLGRLWAKIPNFCGSKVSVPTKRKNHLGNLSTLFFGRAWDQMGQKCRYLAKFDCFWGEIKQNFWYPHIREPMRHLFRVENIDRRGSNRSPGTKMCNLDPTLWIFGAKSQFFVWQSRYLPTGHITIIPGATTFPKCFFGQKCI